MARPRRRVKLEDGLRLNLNRLVRNGIVRPGLLTGARGMRWTYTYTDELAATATVEADMRGESGWLRIDVDGATQTVGLTSQPRRLGGRQWYFTCPKTGRRVSVLWMPPGAHRFASRHAWGRRVVAYASQFETRHGRALAAAQRIRARLGGAFYAPLDGLDPPKPKWMRKRTYQRMLERSWRYEDIADQRLFVLAARWVGAG